MFKLSPQKMLWNITILSSLRDIIISAVAAYLTRDYKLSMCLFIILAIFHAINLEIFSKGKMNHYVYIIIILKTIYSLLSAAFIGTISATIAELLYCILIAYCYFYFASRSGSQNINTTLIVVPPIISAFIVIWFNMATEDAYFNIRIDMSMKLNLILGSIASIIIISNLLLHLLTGSAITREQIMTQKATMDQLTRLPNRNALLSYYSQYVSWSGECLVAIIDIDKFKSFNDTFGHDFGDETLFTVAQSIRRYLISRFGTGKESPVMFGRWGGEEFILIAQKRPGLDSAALLENIRKTVEETILKTDDEKRVRVTISVGGYEYHGSESPMLETLIELADENLYKAKETGRNRVVLSRG